MVMVVDDPITTAAMEANDIHSLEGASVAGAFAHSKGERATLTPPSVRYAVRSTHGRFFHAS